MGEHVFQSVAFQPRKDFRQFWYQLAKLLRARHGSKIHLYASTPEEARYYRQLDTDGVFDSVTVGYSVLLHAAGQQNLDESEVFARARSIEARIGTTFNAIAATDRHLGRGYSPGGYYYARSELSETTSHVQMVHAIATMLEFWEEQIRDKGVTVFLGGSKYQAVVARAHGVPFCSQLGAGYGNYEYWATDEFNETEQLELAFDSARPASRKIEPMSAPYLQYQVLRSPILEQARLSVFLRDMVRIAARHYYGRMRGYEKTRMSLLSSVFRRRFRRMTGLRRMSRLPFRPLSFLEGKRFVFFPLQTEPETGISFASPEYLSQHHAVIQVSRNLPAGTLLAVKDHFLTVGRRPPAFYDQIAELKNVVLLDARASEHQVGGGVHDPAQGAHDRAEHPHGDGDRARPADPQPDGEGLGRDLAEQQEDGRHDQDVDPPRDGLDVPRFGDGEHGGESDRREGDVHQLVAQQDRGEQATRLLQEAANRLRGRGLVVVLQLLQLVAIEREEGRLRPGEERRSRQQEEHQ